MATDANLGRFNGTPTPDGHMGISYVDFLEHLARVTGARAYLEIGTSTGASLERVHCPAVCVDPAFRLKAIPPVDAPPRCSFR